MSTVFHSGEILIQTESGVEKRADKMGNKLIRDHIIDQHKEFFENLNYVFIALHGRTGKPWITFIQGPAGFIFSPNETTLNISTKTIAQDELGLQVWQGNAVGIVGLDLSNRRRNRLNGNFKHSEHDEKLSIKVGHSFGNCPKYIQLRNFEPYLATEKSLADKKLSVRNNYEHIVELSENDVNLIEAADTLFIASSKQQHSDLDASHRGGNPGFVRVNDNKELWFNDYPGNNFFQTFGNVQNYSYVGLMFIDFDSGDLLLLSGQSRLEKVNDQSQVNESNFLPRRFHFTLEKGLRVKQAVNGTWSEVEMSPFLNKIEDQTG